MSHPGPRARIAMLLLLAVAGAAPAASTSAPTPYQRRWSTIDGGGGIPSTHAATGYRLGGTVGQPDAYVMTSGAYRLRGGFWSGPVPTGSVGVPEDPAAAPLAFRALAPSPNPSRGACTVAFELPDTREVAVSIRDVQGRLVRTLDHSRRDAGAYRLPWDGLDDAGRRAPRGLYFVQIDAGADRRVAKLVLLPEGAAR